jgi:4'-phosphopantetheinyl transferase
MIRWLVQTTADHPLLSADRPPAGLLTPAELAQYQGYLNPRRRRDWLLGRWTAKRLLQKHMALTAGFSPPSDSFTIEYDTSGAPYLAGTHPTLRGVCSNGRLALALSISHSSGYALCALASDTSGQVRIGADIEAVEARSEPFAQEFLTAAEQANVNGAPPALRDLLLTATWSAKEATLKATHLALRTDPRCVECIVRPAAPRHWTPLCVQIEPTVRTQSGVTGPLKVWWRTVDNRLRPRSSLVLTIAAFGVDL